MGELCLRTEEEAGYAVGDQLTLGFDPSLAMVFLKDSGERLI